MSLHVYDESRQWGHYDNVGHAHEQQVSQPSVQGAEFRGDYEVYLPRSLSVPAPLASYIPAPLAAAPDEILGLPRKYVVLAGAGFLALAAAWFFARRRS